MAFTTMHFAVGMAGAGGLAILGCSILGRGWRYTPVAMTLGGIWAIVPDLPRLFTEDFPNLPFASFFGRKSLQLWLNEHGNLFFFHHLLDAQPREFALHGLLGILLMYNLAIVGLLIPSKRPNFTHPQSVRRQADPRLDSRRPSEPATIVGKIDGKRQAG